MIRFIYIVENKVSGKAYVGQTADPETREQAHFRGWSRCPALTAAVQKYGACSFQFSLLEVCCSPEQANAQEIYWIKHLNTLVPDGYNLKEGGQCGGCLSKTTRDKISASRKGKCLGINNPQYGKLLTEEHKWKISQANRGKAAGKENYWFGKFGAEHPRGGRSNSEAWYTMVRERMSGRNSYLYGKRGKDTPHFGKKHSEQTKAQISAKKKGQPGYWLGKKRSEETKQKIRDAWARKRAEKEHR